MCRSWMYRHSQKAWACEVSVLFSVAVWWTMILFGLVLRTSIGPAGGRAFHAEVEAMLGAAEGMAARAGRVGGMRPVTVTARPPAARKLRLPSWLWSRIAAPCEIRHNGF